MDNGVARGTYRGWTITQGRWPEPEWMATGPNYDASYEGEEDGWVDNGQKANAATYEALIEEIDAWFEEHGEPDIFERVVAALREAQVVCAQSVNSKWRADVRDRVNAALAAYDAPTPPIHQQDRSDDN